MKINIQQLKNEDIVKYDIGHRTWYLIIKKMNPFKCFIIADIIKTGDDGIEAIYENNRTENFSMNMGEIYLTTMEKIQKELNILKAKML